MKNKAYTLIELLSVIVILAVISAIAVPKIIDIIAISKLNAYNEAKNNIVDSAKLKYLSDVNSSKITQYTIDDLVEDGYLKENIKNPITNQKYENTKIVITNEDGNIKYDYIEGNTLYDIIINLNDTSGLYKENDNYLYKGIYSKNYISFNGDIYRIIKVDSYRNIYILKDKEDELININNIDDFIKSYYNDNYLQEEKNSILSIDILEFDDYVNSYIDNESYIENNYSMWVKENEKYKCMLYDELIDEKNANVRFVLKLKGSTIIKRGNGSQVNPYIIN